MKNLLLGCILILGCGAPSFTGVYRGSLSEILACPSGVNAAGSFGVIWTFTQTDNHLNIALGSGECTPISALVDSKSPDTATIDSKVCAPAPDQFGGIVTQSIIDGEFTMENNGNITMFMRSTQLFHDPGFTDETCAVADFGNLVLEK